MNLEQHKGDRKDFLTQEELRYVYETAQKRCEYHPEIAGKYRKTVEALPVYKDRYEAIKKAVYLSKKGISHYQVWAFVGKNNEEYYIQDYYIISNNNLILKAAEYIGMEQIFM